MRDQLLFNPIFASGFARFDFLPLGLKSIGSCHFFDHTTLSSSVERQVVQCSVVELRAFDIFRCVRASSEGVGIRDSVGIRVKYATSRCLYE